jgi:small-conductance mechanosensitive channel
MLPSADTILIAALAIFVATIAIFIFRILLGVQQLVWLGEMRRDYLPEEQAHLAPSEEERLGIRTEMEGERLEQNTPEEPNGLESPQEESKGLESLPIAGPHQEKEQNLEIQHRADKLEEEILQFKQDYRKLEKDLKQVREHQQESDQEKERIMKDLQNIRQILNGEPTSPQGKK